MQKEQILKAINYAINDEWESSHSIVQSIDDNYAYWVHAVLHRVEGDIFNSKYWYSKAKRKFTTCDPKLELEEIKAEVSLL